MAIVLYKLVSFLSKTNACGYRVSCLGRPKTQGFRVAETTLLLEALRCCCRNRLATCVVNSRRFPVASPPVQQPRRGSHEALRYCRRSCLATCAINSRGSQKMGAGNLPCARVRTSSYTAASGSRTTASWSRWRIRAAIAQTQTCASCPRRSRADQYLLC